MVVPLPITGLTVNQFGTPLILHDVQLVPIVNEALPPVSLKVMVLGDTLRIAFAPFCVIVTVWVRPQPEMVSVAVRD